MRVVALTALIAVAACSSGKPRLSADVDVNGGDAQVAAVGLNLGGFGLRVRP